MIIYFGRWAEVYILRFVMFDLFFTFLSKKLLSTEGGRVCAFSVFFSISRPKDFLP